MDAVTAAALADAAFDAVGEATQFSTQRYRETIEQLCQTGKLTSGKEFRAAATLPLCHQSSSLRSVFVDCPLFIHP
jgi:hypothetical protein